MTSKKETSELIDRILYGLSIGTIAGTALLAPNAIQLLEKPINQAWKKLDKREKERQLSKLRSYLKTQGLVRGDYDHGIVLTKKAYKRIAGLQFTNLQIKKPDDWDKKWRIVMFDIPENQRHERRSFTNKIQSLGFQILQQSVWVHPYPCRDEIAYLTETYKISEWVTYIEVSDIDNSHKLEKRFQKLLSS